MTDPNTPGTTKQAMPFDNLLAQSRNLVCELLGEALDGMLDNVDDTLSALMNETQDPEMRKVYSETRNKVLAQRKTIAEQFRAQYLREFQARSNRVKKTGQSFSDLDSYSLELDLVGEDDLNETLKLNDMATKLRQYCDEELVALDQRVGVLLGDANLEAEDNPFSPMAICDAYKLTCRQVDSNVKVRMVLLTLFDDHVLDDIRSVYKAVNALLVQNSILPKIRFRVARGQEGSKAPPVGARAGEETQRAVSHSAEKTPGGEQDFFSVLQNLLAGSVKAKSQPDVAGEPAPAPGAFAIPGLAPPPGAPVQGVAGIPGFPPMAGTPAQGVAAMPGFPPMAGAPGLGRMDGAPMVVLQGAELMSLLTRVQQGDTKAVPEGGAPLVTSAAEPGTTNVLRELKATSLGTGMNQLDSMTLDIVAMLFDQLFDDPKIPISVKGLIGRMQIPMLKVAIADKAFFSRKTHPARQLLDTLGEISARLPGDFNASNPVFGRLEGIIQELMDSFQDDVEIFGVVRERLQNLLQEEDQRIEEEARFASRRIEQNESLAASKTMAEYEVKTRVEAGNLPRPVIEFLMHQWVKPLLIVHVRRGQHSDAWKNSLATMDLLIWSVEAKHTPEERQDLTTIVPELFKRLTAGLKIADIEDAIRERFFADLKKLHAEAMSAGEEGEVAEAHGASAENLSLESDGAPTMKFDFAPATQPDAAPVTNPDAVPAMTFDAAPPTTKPEAAPATKPDVVPVMKFEVAPPIEPESAQAAMPDAAPAANPDAFPVMSFEFVPPIKPETAPAAKPDAAPATSPDALHVMQFDVGPANERDAVPAAKPDAAPATSPDAVPVMKFDAAPSAIPVAAPPATPVVAPAAATQTPKPVAPPPATRPVAEPVTKPVAAPATKAAVAPTAAAQGPKPAAAPTATPAVAPTAAAQGPKPAPAPPATPVVAPAAATQTSKPAGAPTAKPTAASLTKPGAVPATKPAAMQVTMPGAVPAAKPFTAPVIKPGAVPAAKPTTTSVAMPAAAQAPKPQPAPAAKPLPEPRKTAQPIPASARKATAPVDAQGADSDSLDFTKTLTIKNPFGAGQVHVKELETADARADGAPRAKGEVNEVEFIKNLKVGTWVEFRDKVGDDTHKPAKLSYISPLRSSFLFVDKQGKTVKECSRTELGRLVRIGMVVVVVDVVADEAPLFDRMMAGVIGKLT